MPTKKKIFIVGDNIMVRPEEGTGKTRSGLYLPATVVDKDAVMGGWVVEVGPGLAYPEPFDGEEEPWRKRPGRARYVPQQAEEGDYAIFIRKAVVEIEYDDQKYIIVPGAAVLALVREEPVALPSEVRSSD
jgi:chaperonin GroES